MEDQERRSKDRRDSIQLLEDEVRKDLFPRIMEPLGLLIDTLNLAYIVLQSAFPTNNVTRAKSVCTKLLLRLLNDLRAIWILTDTGYDIQANALAASVYECCFAIATIGDDEELAKAWIKHDDPVKTFKDAKTLTRCGLERYGGAEWAEKTDFYYQKYTQFCWGKHLNPIMELQGNVEVEQDLITWVTGPSADALTERGVWFCCNYCVTFAFIALSIYFKHHVIHDRIELKKFFVNINDRQLEAHKKALERWGGLDPWPGKWKKSAKPR
jgi:hypothetical protein